MVGKWPVVTSNNIIAWPLVILHAHWGQCEVGRGREGDKHFR